MVAEQEITGYEYRKLQKELEQLKRENERLKQQVRKYNWRKALDTVSSKLLSPAEKLLACIVQEKIFSEQEADADGFYSVWIGQKPFPENLSGMTGLSHDTISKALTVFQTSGLIEKKMMPGTAVKKYKDC